MFRVGGNTIFLSRKDTQLSRNEPVKDTARVLSRYLDAIAIRTFSQELVEEMAHWADIPVINALTDKYHPCQVLSDLMTIKEKHPDTSRLKVSIIWAYATSHKKPISVPLTQILLFPRYKMDVTLAYPEGFELPDWAIEEAEANANKYGGEFRITHDMEEAYKDADIVIPKNWGSWSTKNPDVNIEDFKDWKCTEKLMETANKNVYYMHALPADRGNEVEDSVIDGEHSIVYQEAENRLHTAKGVMSLIL
jgi:ornithine carbamoyltransferase